MAANSAEDTLREPYKFAIKIRFTLWQRLRVLLGQSVWVVTREDYKAHESWVAYDLPYYVPKMKIGSFVEDTPHDY